MVDKEVKVRLRSIFSLGLDWSVAELKLEAARGLGGRKITALKAFLKFLRTPKSKLDFPPV